VSYGRIGDLEVRLAVDKADVRRAQALRYQVFYEEMAARASTITRFRRRDEDAFDAICDHLLVVDHAASENAFSAFAPTSPRAKWSSGRRPKVVGTYRVLRQQIAERHGGFYTQGEYNIAPLVEALSPQYRFLELGRSCVLREYRNKRSVELLWHGLWTYAREHGIDVMLGCASFPGTNPDNHAMALSFLHHNAPATGKWACRAHEHLYVPMNRMDAAQVDMRSALKAMPPLIKGYLRLGAVFGDGAVIDHQFSTTDVLVILAVENIDPRYFGHFGTPDEKTSRIAGRKHV